MANLVFSKRFPKGRPSTLCPSTQCPITLYAPVASFRSIVAAARHLGVGASSIKDSLRTGSHVKNHFAVYADMPIACQPRKKRIRQRQIPVVWEGKFYPSINAAAGGNRSKWMKIWREAGRSK